MRTAATNVMRPGETSWGGPRGPFPETSWGLVSRLTNRFGDDFRQGLETLCQRYWKPIYAYLRVCRKGNEEAKDLTQAFFLWLMEGDTLQRFEPRRGGFRPYLKVLLRRFVSHQEQALRRLKRGGGVRVFTLREDESALENMTSDGETDPEKVLDRAWVAEVVRGAVERVRERYVSGGKEVAFRAYESYDQVPPAEQPSYSELAARLGLTERQLRTCLTEVRRQVRSEIRAELARLTSNDGELEREWNELLGS